MNLYPDKGALDLLNEPVKPVHSFIRWCRLTPRLRRMSRWKRELAYESADRGPEQRWVMEGRQREQLEGWIPSLAGENEVSSGAGEGLRLSRGRDAER